MMLEKVVKGVANSTVLAGALFAVSSGAFSQDKGKVNIYHWAEYVAEDTIPRFEQMTGIKVNFDTFDNNDVLQTKLLIGNSGYDVVIPSSYYAKRQIEAGLLEKLDKSQLPNLKNLDPEIMKLLEEVDPGNEYLVPWAMGTLGLGYNMTRAKEVAGEDVDFMDWGNLFDPEKAKKFSECGISIYDEAGLVFPAVLNYIGKDPATQNPDDYLTAFEVLKSIRPYIKHFSPAGYIEELAQNDLCLVYGGDGDVYIAKDRAKESNRPYEIGYFIPEGGALVWMDMMAVAKGAPNFDNAMAFINYMEIPEVHAEITNEMFFSNANLESVKHVKPEIANDPMLYPPPDVRDTLFLMQPQSMELLRLQTRLWAELKAGR